MLERRHSKYEALCIHIFWPFGRRKVTESDVTASNTLTFILSSAQRDEDVLPRQSLLTKTEIQHL